MLLFALGFLGWALFKLLRLPVPALLGTITVIGVLRSLGVDLPIPPPYLTFVLQVMIGIVVGSRINQDVADNIKSMVKPALIIVIWAVSIVFLLGVLLDYITYLDIFTAVLSSSMGGLPEITMIALATDADVAVIIIIQSVRMIVTIVVFPLMLKMWLPDVEPEKKTGGKPEHLIDNSTIPRDNAFYNSLFRLQQLVREIGLKFKKRISSYLINRKDVYYFLRKFAFTMIIALSGGLLLYYIGIPAGGMVGSTLFIAFASLKRFPVISLPNSVFELMLVGVGIIVSANISTETVEVLTSGKILLPVLLSTILIFLSSFLISHVISRTSGWDFPTSFLAAAPGGFTVMTALAVTYKMDPFRVSMLHLSRLIALKTVIPLTFWFIL